MFKLTFLIVWILLVVVVLAEQEGLREVILLEDGTHIQIQQFSGPSKLAAPKHLFTTASVRVECPSMKVSLPVCVPGCNYSSSMPGI